MPIEILMPALSPTMEEGTLSKWLVKEGDTVVSGDLLAEIETDKATMEFEAVDEGVIGKLLVAEGTEGVKVNTAIALIGEEGEDFSAAPAPAAEEPATAAPKAPAPAAAAPAPAAPAASDGARVFASPLARRIAKDKGLDLANVTGSGPHGRIVKADVEAAQPGAAAAPAVDKDHFVLETLLAVQSIPAAQSVSLEKFELTPERISIEGSAAGATQALRFLDALSGAEQFADYDWTFPQPSLDGATAHFEIQGVNLSSEEGSQP